MSPLVVLRSMALVVSSCAALMLFTLFFLLFFFLGGFESLLLQHWKTMVMGSWAGHVVRLCYLSN